MVKYILRLKRTKINVDYRKSFSQNNLY